jgi:hypothetical protein
MTNKESLTNKELAPENRVDSEMKTKKARAIQRIKNIISRIRCDRSITDIELLEGIASELIIDYAPEQLVLMNRLAEAVQSEERQIMNEAKQDKELEKLNEKQEAEISLGDLAIIASASSDSKPENPHDNRFAKAIDSLFKDNRLKGLRELGDKLLNEDDQNIIKDDITKQAELYKVKFKFENGIFNLTPISAKGLSKLAETNFNDIKQEDLVQKLQEISSLKWMNQVSPDDSPQNPLHQSHQLGQGRGAGNNL